MAPHRCFYYLVAARISYNIQQTSEPSGLVYVEYKVIFYLFTFIILFLLIQSTPSEG